MKRKKKTPLRKAQDKLWELCKKIIRRGYPPQCYTCGAENLAGANLHTGHFIPSSICGAYLRYDLRNLRPQCFRCNIWLTGNGSAFYRNMVHIEGQKYVDTLFKDKEKIIKADVGWYEAKITEYTELLASLNG